MIGATGNSKSMLHTDFIVKSCLAKAVMKIDFVDPLIIYMYMYEDKASKSALLVVYGIYVEPTTNCNSNESYVILFQIYYCITY